MEWLLIAITLFVLYLAWDRSRHPKKWCRRCQGTGRKTSRISGQAFGRCQRCGGKGELRR